MQTIRFTIEETRISSVDDAAYVGSDESVYDALKEGIWQSLRLDLNVTVGGVTFFAAAWEDPEHWAEDWAEKLGVELDEAPQAVADHIAAHTTTTDL